MKHFLRHLFLPHESNNHRAKILHIDSILIVITLLIFSSFLLSSLQSRYPAVLGISYNITPADLLNQTNKFRQENGLSPLTLNSQLSLAASNKASDMFAKDYWAHIAPDGVTPWVFIKNAGYEYLYAGENLARGFSNTSDVVNAWMASPSHRENMLSSNYSEIGFAISTGTLTGTETVLVVEMFGRKYKNVEAAPSIIPSPTAAIVATEITPVQLELTPTITIPTPTTSGQQIAYIITNTPVPAPVAQAQKQVASVQQLPLIDKNDLTKNIIVIVLIVMIAILTIDAIIIERKRVIRVVSHNLDHIIYLIIILLSIIIIGKGLVL